MRGIRQYASDSGQLALDPAQSGADVAQEAGANHLADLVGASRVVVAERRARLAW